MIGPHPGGSTTWTSRATPRREAGRAEPRCRGALGADRSPRASTSPDEAKDVKDALRRKLLYAQAWSGWLSATSSPPRRAPRAIERQIAVRRIPFEIRLRYALGGMIARAGGEPRVAAAELAQGTQQDPRVIVRA